MNRLAEKCYSLSNEVADYLATYLLKHKGFVLRSFYGESFSLNLLARANKLTPELTHILLSEYERKDKKDPEFHFEFNNYAFLDYGLKFNDEKMKALISPLVFKGTSCTNWTLLRANVRLMLNSSDSIALTEWNEKLSMQEESGLILDDPGVKSFQYHCFSAAMLGEIYLKNPNEKLRSSFIKAVSFIRHFILEDGSALYIGRGQQQSFGLGVLVYLLALAYKINQEASLLSEINVVLNYLEKFKRQDGSFPLVFNGNEPRNPQNVKMDREEFCGWYPYNNYFDYLPFFAYFLSKAAELLKDVNESSSEIHVLKSYSDKDFHLIAEKKYAAILSRPGGYWTNDLPFPLIYYNGRFQTPMLGGEQFQRSLYSLQQLSMPTTTWKSLSWRKFGRGWWSGNSLIWISIFGVMIRKFDFNTNEIHVRHFSLYWFPSTQNISFLYDLKKVGAKEYQAGDISCYFSSEIDNEATGYSASGKLKVVQFKMNVSIRLELR